MTLRRQDLEDISRRTLDHYERGAEDFWKGTRDHDVSQNIAALLRHIAGTPPFVILDLGCGPGRDLKAFSDLGHVAVGLEGSERFAAMAREHSGCEVWKQDLLALSLPEARFDGVFANAVLFHVPAQELPRVLRELRATLKPGGVLFSSNPRGENEEGWNRGRYGAYHDLETWRRFMTAAGFEELEHYYRPNGLPRERQPWLASVWRRVPQGVFCGAEAVMLDIRVEPSALRRGAAKFARLRADARRWGWMRVVLARLATWLRERAGIHFYGVNLRPLDARPPAPVLPPGIRLSRMPAETLLRAAEDPELDLDRGFVREALARGDLCFGALEGERLVSYAWRSVSAAPARDGMWVRVAPPCHYAYKAFTLPAWRGRRLHIAVSLASDEHFRASGRGAEVGFNEITNYAIGAAADYLGRRRIGYAGYLKWFGRRIPFRTRALEKIGFEFFEPREET